MEINESNIYKRKKRCHHPKYDFISCSRPPRPTKKQADKIRKFIFGKAIYNKKEIR